MNFIFCVVVGISADDVYAVVYGVVVVSVFVVASITGAVVDVCVIGFVD